MLAEAAEQQARSESRPVETDAQLHTVAWSDENHLATAESGTNTPQLDDMDLIAPATQFSQSLDHVMGHTAVLLGGSSEADPWLLRHCRFDDYGLRQFHELQFRHVGGVPTVGKIPVHFLVTPDNLIDGAAAETQVAEINQLREQLNQVIPLAWGVRLVRLWVLRQEHRNDIHTDLVNLDFTDTSFLSYP